MHRKVIVVLLFCCFIAGTTGIAFSQEKSSSDTNLIDPNSTVISIPADGEVYFNKVRISLADVPERVRQALKDKPPDEQVAYIKAGISVSYGFVISVIDAIREAGIDQIGLVAEKRKTSQVKTDIPTNNSGKSAPISSADSTPILIQVRNKTRLKLNSKPLLLSQLDQRLSRILAGRSNKTVFIKAPTKMAYGDVVKIIDIAKSAGAKPVGLQIDDLK